MSVFHTLSNQTPERPQSETLQATNNPTGKAEFLQIRFLPIAGYVCVRDNRLAKYIFNHVMLLESTSQTI